METKRQRTWDREHTSSYLKVKKVGNKWQVYLHLITLSGEQWTKIYAHHNWKWAIHHALQIIHCTNGRTSDMPFEYHYNGWYGEATERSSNELSSNQTT